MKPRSFSKHRILPLIVGFTFSLLPCARGGITPGSKNIGAVWFIGDSITQSSADGDAAGSPRKSLYDLLVAGGYTFSYTGHFTANVDGLPTTGATAATNLYHYHSGISGSVIGDTVGSNTGMTQNLSSMWSTGRTATVKPDVILIMLGTNDVNQLIDLPNAPARLTALVNAIFAQPDVGNPTIFISSIAPNRTTLPIDPENVAAFNASLSGVVSDLRTAGKDVHLVDSFRPIEDYYRSAMTSDNLHPNALGNHLIAQNWMNGISAVVGSSVDRIKASTGTDLSLAGAWDILPTNQDSAVWATGSLGGPLVLGSAQSWGGINIQDATASLTLSGAPLTLTGFPIIEGVANAGINLAAAGKDLSISNDIVLAGNQTWTVGQGRTFTTHGVTSGAFPLKYSGSGNYVVDGINTATKSVIIDGATVRVNPGKSLLAASAHLAGSYVTVKNHGVLECYNWDYGSGNVLGMLADAATSLVLDGGGTIRTLQSITSTENRGITVDAGGGVIDVTSGTTFDWQANGSVANTLNGVLTISGAGTFNFNRPLSWAATGGLVKSGTGTLSMTAPISVGSSGTFTGSGGTLINTSGTGLTIANGGTSTISSGTYTFAGTTGWAYNYGTYIQTGGTVNFSQKGLDGGQPTTVVATTSVTGGSLNILNDLGYINITNNGTGTLTIGGEGTVDTPALYFMHPSLTVGTGTLNLNTGGKLVVNKINTGGNTTASGQTFNWNGGLLKAKSSTFGTWANSTRINVKVQAGGAAVDSNGQSIIIGQVLTHDPALGFTPDGGLKKSGAGTLSLTGANSYTGPTVVTEGILAVNGSAIVDTNVLVANGGKIQATGTEVVGSLFFGNVQQVAGTWGATNSGATHIDDDHFSGTAGVVEVKSGPVTNTYSNWIASFPGAAVAPAFDEDADGDGLANAIEHLLGTDPTSANNGIVQVSAAAGSVTFRHSQTNTLAADVTKSYEWSTDLEHWHTSGASNVDGTIATLSIATITDNTAPANDMIEVLASVSGTPTPKLFVRLVARQ